MDLQKANQNIVNQSRNVSCILVQTYNIIVIISSDTVNDLTEASLTHGTAGDCRFRPTKNTLKTKGMWRQVKKNTGRKFQDSI